MNIEKRKKMMVKSAQYYDEVVIVNKDGSEKKHMINVSTYEGAAERDKILTRARKSKKVVAVDLIANAKKEYV